MRVAHTFDLDARVTVGLRMEPCFVTASFAYVAHFWALGNTAMKGSDGTLRGDAHLARCSAQVLAARATGRAAPRCGVGATSSEVLELAGAYGARGIDAPSVRHGADGPDRHYRYEEVAQHRRRRGGGAPRRRRGRGRDDERARAAGPAPARPIKNALQGV